MGAFWSIYHFSSFRRDISDNSIMKITMDNLCPKHRNTIGKMGNISKDLSSRSLLLVTALLCLVPIGSSQGLKFNRNSVEMKQAAPAGEPLSLLWGIADTTAYVGKLFTYTLPNDAFQGNIVHYDVSMIFSGMIFYFLFKGKPG